MCGIAGIVTAPGDSPDPSVLNRMAEAMAHRGPNEGGVTLFGECGLAFRRLSIIDVAGGQQPIANEDETCWIILNGEIYNYLELRTDLEARGHRFRTRSDAESVLHAYEEFGVESVAKLRGMFAFAIWDQARKRLFVARDRVGKKPLCFYANGGRLTFASELKALLQNPAVPREVDLTAIHHYLTYQYVPSPLTGFESVRKLPPAHYLVFENGAVHQEKYWTLRYSPKLRLSQEEAAAEVASRLRDAVRVRLMSEVPLGAFLSGGIDSGSVVAFMSEFGKVKTFSIGFEEQEYDELEHARSIARTFGCEHREFVVKAEAAEVLPELVEHFGEPFADSSALPTYYLARMTGSEVTVALSGDGGDELFAGYRRYTALNRLQVLTKLSAFAGGSLGRLVPSRFRRGLDVVGKTPEETYARMMSYFPPELKLGLYSEAMRRAVGGVDSYDLLYARFNELNGAPLIDKLLYVDTASYLPDDLLVKVDIAAMANSLEVRCPFLDHSLMEFAARLPAEWKLRSGTAKYILKKAMNGKLPPATLHRAKMGFGIPLERWFRGELRELVSDTVLSPRALARPFFEPEAVRGLAGRHFSRAESHGARLWALLMLELWCRRFIDAAA